MGEFSVEFPIRPANVEFVAMASGLTVAEVSESVDEHIERGEN